MGHLNSSYLPSVGIYQFVAKVKNLLTITERTVFAPGVRVGRLHMFFMIFSNRLKEERLLLSKYTISFPSVNREIRLAFLMQLPN